MLSVEPEVPELVPARMLNEFCYCPRLFFLEWVQSRFADNTDTVEGSWAHRAVDVAGGSIPAPGSDEPFSVARSVQLSSPELGIVAKIDLLEPGPDGRIVPVDHKKGRAPDIPKGHGSQNACSCAPPGFSCGTPGIDATTECSTSGRAASGCESTSMTSSSVSRWSDSRSCERLRLTAHHHRRWSTARSVHGVRSWASVYLTRRTSCQSEPLGRRGVSCRPLTMPGHCTSPSRERG